MSSKHRACEQNAGGDAAAVQGTAVVIFYFLTLFALVEKLDTTLTF